MALDFYKTMQAQAAGEKITTIELVTLTPRKIADAAKPKDGPGGKMALPLKPTKKLVIKIETKNENGSSTSTSSDLRRRGRRQARHSGAGAGEVGV